jgi:hypothetical protein
MSALLSGILPVKQSVDQIMQACRLIVMSGAVPGAETVCAQIISLAQGLLPLALQSMMQPGQGGAPSPMPGGPVPPPPTGQ